MLKKKCPKKDCDGIVMSHALMNDHFPYPNRVIETDFKCINCGYSPASTEELNGLEEVVGLDKYSHYTDLLSDYKDALLREDNNFSKFTLNLINKGVVTFLSEYKHNPNAALGNNKGDWFFIWRNCPIMMNGEWVEQEEIIDRINELLILEQISEGVKQLRNKSNIRLNELLPQLMKSAGDTGKLVSIWMSNSGKPEGADTFNECIWDSDILIDGKVERLNDLFADLHDLHNKRY